MGSCLMEFTDKLAVAAHWESIVLVFLHMFQEEIDNNQPLSPAINATIIIDEKNKPLCFTALRTAGKICSRNVNCFMFLTDSSL